MMPKWYKNDTGNGCNELSPLLRPFESNKMEENETYSERKIWQFFRSIFRFKKKWVGKSVIHRRGENDTPLIFLVGSGV